MTTTFIYVLKDPRDGSVRYVGATGQPEIRQRQHTTYAVITGAPLGSWLRELRQGEIVPQFAVIDRVLSPTYSSYRDVEMVRDAEYRWIQHYRQEGHPLLNVHPREEKGRA